MKKLFETTRNKYELLSSIDAIMYADERIDYFFLLLNEKNNWTSSKR